MSVRTIVVTASVAHRARTTVVTAAVATRVRTTLLRTGPPGADGAPGESPAALLRTSAVGSPNNDGLVLSGVTLPVGYNRVFAAVASATAYPNYSSDGLTSATIRNGLAMVLLYRTSGLSPGWLLSYISGNGVSNSTVASWFGGEAATPDLADWSEEFGSEFISGTPVFSFVTALVGEQIGQICRVGDATPFEWWVWDGTAWEQIDEPVTAADITDSTALGRSLLTAETASAALTELGAGATGKSLLEAESPAAANLILGLTPVTLNHPASLGTNWTHSGGGVYVSAAANSTGYNGIEWQNLTLDTGGIYLLKFDVVAQTSGSLQAFLDNSGARSFLGLLGGAISGLGSYALIIRRSSQANNRLVIRCGNGWVGTLSGISLTKLPF